MIEARLEFEDKKKCHSWISDKLLKAGMAGYYNIPIDYIPDGIFTDENNQLVAFELEIALKGKARYYDKIERYVSIIRGNRENFNQITKVYYRCLRPNVYKIIKEATDIYGDLFFVELISPRGDK